MVLLLPPPIVLPVGQRGSDIALLAILGASSEQNHQSLTVFAEVNPITWSEVDLVLKHTGTDALHVREIAAS